MEMKDRIRERRLALGYTLEYVAKLVGTSKQTIHRYENGIISNIPSDKMELLAAALATTPAYLMGWIVDGEAGEDMTKIGTESGIYRLEDDEENMLKIYSSLNEDGKKELMKLAKLFDASGTYKKEDE